MIGLGSDKNQIAHGEQLYHGTRQKFKLLLYFGIWNRAKCEIQKIIKFHISYISHRNFTSKQRRKDFSIISFVYVLVCRSESATELNCKTCGFDVIQELSEVWKVRTETRSCLRRRLTFTCVYFWTLCSLSSSTRILESEYQFRRN